jgi:hypothetical protein
MFNNIPTAANIMIKLDPPYDTNGSGTPVKGMSATIALRLITVCSDIHDVTPIASNLPNPSCARLAILNPRQEANMNIRMTATPPTKPVSSPIIANIESVLASGRYSYFWRDCPIPTPNHPPDPNPNSACRM